jgi:two-component system, chemotaxis family, chemotaxis protein CheY
MKPTILVVDDQEDERDAMADLLRRQQYVVESAANGQEALVRLCNGAPLPALVLLDLNMPVMDGWEFLYRVAQDTSLRHIPVIVSSGSPVGHDPIVVPESVTFMTKPVRPVAIMKVVVDMLRHATATPAASRNTAAAIGQVDAERRGAARCESTPVAFTGGPGEETPATLRRTLSTGAKCTAGRR